MKKNLLLIILLALLSACQGAGASPTPTSDVNATIVALSEAMTAGTLTAQPTETTVPSATPEPPTPTPIPLTETPTPTLEPTATLTPEPFYGTLDPLGSGDNKTGLFLIENNTGEPEITVTINGYTHEGNPKPIYIAYKVTNTLRFDIPWGDYQYVVQIGKKKTLTGSFIIRNFDKTTMRVSLQKVIVVGP